MRRATRRAGSGSSCGRATAGRSGRAPRAPPPRARRRTRIGRAAAQAGDRLGDPSGCGAPIGARSSPTVAVTTWPGARAPVARSRSTPATCSSKPSAASSASSRTPSRARRATRRRRGSRPASRAGSELRERADGGGHEQPRALVRDRSRPRAARRSPGATASSCRAAATPRRPAVSCPSGAERARPRPRPRAPRRRSSAAGRRALPRGAAPPASRSAEARSSIAPSLRGSELALTGRTCAILLSDGRRCQRRGRESGCSGRSRAHTPNPHQEVGSGGDPGSGATTPRRRRAALSARARQLTPQAAERGEARARMPGRRPCAVRPHRRTRRGSTRGIDALLAAAVGASAATAHRPRRRWPIDGVAGAASSRCSTAFAPRRASPAAARRRQPATSAADSHVARHGHLPRRLSSTRRRARRATCRSPPLVKARLVGETIARRRRLRRLAQQAQRTVDLCDELAAAPRDAPAARLQADRRLPQGRRRCSAVRAWPSRPTWPARPPRPARPCPAGARGRAGRRR